MYFAFILSLASISALGFISYYNFTQLEQKIIIVEAAYDLSNIILEVRRYEKNYFLFSREDDYKETIKYLEESCEMVKKIRPSIKNLEQLNLLNDLAEEFKIYKNLMVEIYRNPLKENSQSDQKMRDLRTTGQKLVQFSENLVDYEHQLILKINKRLTNNLFISLIFVTVFLVFIVIYIIRKVIQPLKLIEETTKSIAIGNFKKVAERKNNDEIHQVIAAFNKMVEELERRQDQLVQAQKLSSIGTLASGIAHQVNNPLNNISTSCQILMEECKDMISDIASKMLRNIESETFRARDIVRGLLEFTRNQEFILTENNLSEVVERSIKLVSSQVTSGVEITQQVPASIKLNFDRQRMQEAFLNLLINAIQAISPKAGQILVVAHEDKEKKQVNISIEDSGKGIPDEIKNRIFDPFFSTKIAEMGTGLGLYIVYGIIQKHSGTIKAEPLMTGGTRFLIKLPTDLKE